MYSQSGLPSLGSVDTDGLSDHQTAIYRHAEQWLQSVRGQLGDNKGIVLANPIGSMYGVICEVLYVNNGISIANLFKEMHPQCGQLQQRFDDETMKNIYTIVIPYAVAPDPRQQHGGGGQTNVAGNSLKSRFVNEPKILMLCLLFVSLSASLTTNHATWKNLGVICLGIITKLAGLK